MHYLPLPWDAVGLGSANVDPSWAPCHLLGGLAFKKLYHHQMRSRCIFFIPNNLVDVMHDSCFNHIEKRKLQKPYIMGQKVFWSLLIYIDSNGSKYIWCHHILVDLLTRPFSVMLYSLLACRCGKHVLSSYGKLSFRSESMAFNIFGHPLTLYSNKTVWCDITLFWNLDAQGVESMTSRSTDVNDS